MKDRNVTWRIVTCRKMKRNRTSSSAFISLQLLRDCSYLFCTELFSFFLVGVTALDSEGFTAKLIPSRKIALICTIDPSSTVNSDHKCLLLDDCLTVKLILKSVNLAYCTESEERFIAVSCNVQCTYERCGIFIRFICPKTV